ncbi:IS3 family transposase [Mycobacterium sp. SM1]|uniref:IS3 family transposase n=1 Tax=Mycobacterium sp. SM1 TaxID=2816243 RepID=UPI001BCFFF32|nr:IS3 family transposase [Mycobacterium sp. SM1]MBS4729893.1 IS3 family transposase [Mycobacterium sp. SM1]
MAELFERSQRTYGSPRIHADLLAEGWKVSVNTVADSMRRQGLAGRKPKRPRGLTRQDKKAPQFPDLLKRDATAAAPNRAWCGDITEIPTDEAKLLWLRSWTCAGDVCWLARCRSTPMRSLPATRSRWPSQYVAGAQRSLA